MTEKEYCLCCNQKRVLTIWNKKALCKRCLFRHKEIHNDSWNSALQKIKDLCWEQRTKPVLCKVCGGNCFMVSLKSNLQIEKICYHCKIEGLKKK